MRYVIIEKNKSWDDAYHVMQLYPYTGSAKIVRIDCETLEAQISEIEYLAICKDGEIRPVEIMDGGFEVAQLDGWKERVAEPTYLADTIEACRKCVLTEQEIDFERKGGRNETV